jgi:GNAT superfamily N-acetyltransferase
MTRPGAERLFAAMEATWPSADVRRDGPLTLRLGRGGNRVTAATLDGTPDGALLDRAEAAMRAAGQAPLWMVRPGNEDLDDVLAARGYRVHEPVWLYLASLAAAEPPPRVSAFAIWPPIAIQRDLWADGHIDADRLAVMERVAGPKSALLARIDDRPAGVAFVAVSDGIGLIHALHVPDALRRRGAARNLMRMAGSWARAQGADWLALAVTRANVAGNGLYASLGMEIVEQYHYRLLAA